ncbi:heparinase II/III domain-containing protein [Zafaria sp. Z1313]|uniref:heparinase II/III domain-containing protein n=1 Tax=Zafaria sp. Z1313 TaxID=3423202 RepID=UPI003D3024EC
MGSTLHRWSAALLATALVIGTTPAIAAAQEAPRGAGSGTTEPGGAVPGEGPSADGEVGGFWEPADLGTVPGGYVPPEVPALRDMEFSSPLPAPQRSKARQSTAAAVPAQYRCQGYGLVPRDNPVSQVNQDIYAWHIYAPAKVGDGRGNINWAANPYKDLGWRLWFHSLRWLGNNIEAGRAGDAAALARAATVAEDWVKDHQGSWKGNTDVEESNTHRLNTLLCLREVLMEQNGGALPANAAWLLPAIHRHAEQNVTRWSGAHNHGSMENLALLRTGCLLGERRYQQTAVDRIAQAFPTQVNAEGLSNEASPSYALFNYSLFAQMQELMTACGWSSAAFNERLGLLGTSVAHMVNSIGRYHQYGDSKLLSASATGTPHMQYAGSNGRQGTAPKHRIAIYKNGMAFGRSSWGSRATGFNNENSWLFRGGTGREKKAHRGDLLEFLYTARGRDVIIEGGHPGIVGTTWRGWGFSEVAHSTTFIPTTVMSKGGPATVTRKAYSPRGDRDFVEMTQAFNTKGQRTRGILVMKDPDIAVVLDRVRINDKAKTHTVETLWNLPSDQTSKVVNRTTIQSSAPGSATKTTIVQVPFSGISSVPAGSTLIHRNAAPGVVSAAPRGHYYPTEQVRVPSDQVVFKHQSNNLGLFSVIVPARSTAAVSVTTGKYPNGATKLTIKVGSTTTVVRVTAGGYMSRVS